MTRSFILMAAMPPTIGHVDLINFAHNLTGDARVILVTRGDEPYQQERFEALVEHFQHNAGVELLQLHQDGLEAEGDDYWGEVLRDYGFQEGDILVASEDWGAVIAEMLHGEFFPYDMNREIRYTKATAIRDDIEKNWAWIIPEFQRRLQKRIVVFGAESTGKSTLAQNLKKAFKDSVTVFEYARPYLELTPGELDVQKMLGIWRGQKALQETVSQMNPTPRVVFLDTDLYTTLGYWQFWDPASVPAGLEEDAELMKADLYIFLNSSIPFQPDPIRLGGDKREQNDAYWRGVLEANNLPYIEIVTDGVNARVIEARNLIRDFLPKAVDHVRLDG